MADPYRVTAPTRPRLDRGALLAALQGVPGVASARLGGDEPDGTEFPDSAASVAGLVGLLRLDLAPGADEVVVATAVGRLLRDRFGLGVDTHRLAVLEETEPAVPVGGAGTSRDLRFARLHLRSGAGRVTAAVTLATGAEDDPAAPVWSGRAEGTVTAAGLYRACAEACLGAAVAAGRVGRDVAVAAVDPAPGHDGVTRVTLAAGRARVVGEAVVRGDERQAVVRAALHAIERLGATA